MSELQLLSNSTAAGMRFLEHAGQAVRAVLGGAGTVLFVPFASGDPDAYTSVARAALARVGAQVASLHEAGDVLAAVRGAEAVFVGGGNSFRLLRALTRLGALDALRRVAQDGVPYRCQRRIEEFLEENDVPVLGLREGAWLRVSGRQAVLAGNGTGRLFRRHAVPADVPAGTDLSYLLDARPRFDVGRDR